MRSLARVLSMLALLDIVSPSTNARAEPSADGVSSPVLVSDPSVPYPTAALRAGYSERVEVVVTLELDATGKVERASVELPQRPEFYEAAAAAAELLRFEPARRGSRAVPARIKFRFVFEPPLPSAPEPSERPAPSPRTPAAPPPPSVLEKPLEVTVLGEHPAPAVKTYSRAEVRQIPGAFGDPFRAVETLPGVTPAVSGIPFFFVRGAPPGNVGYFLDGVRVPYLYHVGFGPSVIQPALVERVNLYPGGYPARIGRFAGGVVDATAVEPRAELHGEGNIRLFDAGGMMEAGFAGGRGTALLGGRYAYTGAILSLVAPDTKLDYRDYQARLSYDVTPNDRLSVFAFGSYDLLSNVTPSRAAPGGETEEVEFGTEFYRADLRYDHFWNGGRLRTAVTLGFDRSNVGFLAGEPRNVLDRSAAVRVEAETKLSRAVQMRGGADVTLDAYSVESARYGDPDDPERQMFDRVFQSRDDVAAGAWVDAVLDVTPRLEVTPGVRVDGYRSGSASHVGVDPRVAARFAVTRSFRIVHAYGLVHQPPSFALPLSALVPVQTKRPLQKSLQAGAGVELDLDDSTLLSLNLFQNAFFDSSDSLAVIQEDGPPYYEARSQGSALGAELFLKRRLTKRLGGFVSYTLSRSVRSVGRERFLSAFDRTHVANAAVAYDLGRGWRPGARFVFYTGTPTVPRTGGAAPPPRTTHATRDPPFYRLDVRVEKRWSLGTAAWISLVVEVMNATLHKETFGGEEIGPITIPSIGAEAGF